MSPGLMPRPSLSDVVSIAIYASPSRVAGVDAPAFVERSSTSTWRKNWTSVAGVDAPAFVERQARLKALLDYDPVSPGLMPRPSLSDSSVAAMAQRLQGVAGVDAPAFVERSVAVHVARLPQPGECRRG